MEAKPNIVVASPLVFGDVGRIAGAVKVDLERLIVSRGLIEANSGAGKSTLLRALCEGTFGRVQHLLFDPEDEYASLREKFPYVLAARSGGDVEVSARTAATLCRRLMELRASTIIGLYDLSRDERAEFVKRFLIELMSLPRELWHAALVLIDEIQKFAPEGGHGEAVSTDAVIDLACQGRKRGFSLVGATQRISKLAKDVAAELLNKFVGRTGLDTDVKRAGDDLGFDKAQRFALKTLKPGDFFAYGPAISNEVILVHGPPVITTHPKAGKITAAPPPPPDEIRAVLAQLGDIPKEAETRAQTIEQFQKENRELRHRLSGLETQLKRQTPPTPKSVRVEVPILKVAVIGRLETASRKLFESADKISTAMRAFEDASATVRIGITDINAAIARARAPAPPPPITNQVTVVGGNQHGKTAAAKAVADAFRAAGKTVLEVLPETLDAPPRVVAYGRHLIETLAKFYPMRPTAPQWAGLAKRSSKSSSLDEAIAWTVRAKYVEKQGDEYVITDHGKNLVGHVEPTGDLVEHWRSVLPAYELKLFNAFPTAGAVSPEQLAADANVSATSSSFDAAVSSLVRNKIIRRDGKSLVWNLEA